MATVTTTIDSTAYVQVTTAPTDAIIQNTGTADVLLIFQVAQPVVGASNYHILKAKDNQAFQVISGVPADNAWVRVYSDNLVGQVAVSA